MNIIVLVKQVPETSNVKMDPETGTMIREGLETIINPLDLYAIEAALRLKEQHGGKVTALSMGPPAAMKALRECMAMGCDDAALVSDRKFGGADTWATSYTLTQAINEMGEFDLILAGERATDGDTGQVGPGVGAWMNLPVVSYVAHVKEVTKDSITCERLMEEGYQVVKVPFPAVITTVKEIAEPRLPTLRGNKRARQTEIPVYSTENMTIDVSKLGLKGSPTKVVKIETPKVTRSGTIVKANSEEALESAVDQLVEWLKERELV
ncbi:MAG: electron transfer flavoprotein subunit beta/FixA family protein [Spirochaetaceae bacterium]|nr:MAG: electron transfer flavoprotein subunit beta/FixA family protein [Spirochaetaceae bacterium]